MKPRPPWGGQEGLTMVEVMVLVALFSITLGVFTRFMFSTRQAANHEEAAGELLIRSQRIATNLRGGLQSCAELITAYGDSTGTGMLPLHQLVTASVQAAGTVGVPAPVSFTGWPTVLTAAEVDLVGPTDPGAVNWGDEIMYLSQLNPLTFTAYYTQSGAVWVPGGSPTSTSTTAEVISVQRYQFVYDYLSLDSRSYVPGSGPGLRLTEWRSQPYVAYSSLSSLSDTPSVYTGDSCCPRLTATCQYLQSAGYDLAFDPTAVTLTTDCSSCFYLLEPGTISSGTPVAAPQSLSTSSWGYVDDYDEVQNYNVVPGVVLGRVARADGGAGGQVAGPTAYCVAFNATGVSSALSVVGLLGGGAQMNVPAFAALNDSMPGGLGGPGFPAGFEVSVDGQYGSREIYMRLVLMALNGGNSEPGIEQAQQTITEIAVSPNNDF